MRKKYQLASIVYRKAIDLRKYKNAIEEAVYRVKKGAKVIVSKDGFEIIPEPSKIESIQISRLLRSDCMEKFTMYRPCLFNGYRIGRSEKNEEDPMDDN